MEVNPRVLEGFGVVNGCVNLYGDGSATIDSNVEESENPENVILEDLDSYWEDINDRFTISRMVSDSVIKGMVNAIEQEAAEKIAEKELELVRLKESLHLYHVGAEKSEPFGSLVVKHASGSVKHGSYSSLSDALFDYNKIGESMGSLKNVAKEQLKNLRKEIDRIKGSGSLRRIGSGSEMVGLGGILQDKLSDIKWMDVDRTFDSLRTTLDTICKRVDNMVYSSKTSICQWQQEKEFEQEIEDMVIMTCIRSLKEEYEERLWGQSAWLHDNESLIWLEKIKEISILREELNAISKSLSVPEIGHISSHGSMGIGEEWDTYKRTDHVRHKISNNHMPLSTSLYEGNGKHDESVIAMPENLDFNQLKHMPKEELMNYFKIEMTKMKRNHEHKVTEMTEDYFSLKREYLRLRERGSSLPTKKDKEFDMMRKKIPEVLLKLDGIIVEKEKSPTFCRNGEGLCSLKDRLESLLLENRQLRTLLTDKKNEVKRLSLQVSDNAEIMLLHSFAEANLAKRIGNLRCALDDAHIEASISEDVYKCLLGEAVDSIKSISEKSDLEYKLMQEVSEIVFSQDAHNAKPSGQSNFEDSDLESVIMQELCEAIFKEALKEAEVKLDELNHKCRNETELRVSVENEALEKERALRSEVSEKERLKKETHSLSSLVEEKGKLANEAVAALLKEKDRCELVSQELNNLRDETSWQLILIAEGGKELDDVKGKLIKALEQIEQYKVEMLELKQKLELAKKESREANEEKKLLLSVTKQKQQALSLVEAKDKEHRKQMQSLISHIQGLLKTMADFECSVMEDILRSNLRLDSLSSQSRDFIQKANAIKRTGLIYKQKLERKCSDLQKAEAEVDLLGDEVDTLLSLLKKIYIALDHYSPIFQHYPGIIEILKLARRELSGESTRPV